MTDRFNTIVTLKSGRDFEAGRAYAKKHGGTFNPDTKEWTIPGDHMDCELFSTRGLVMAWDEPSTDIPLAAWLPTGG